MRRLKVGILSAPPIASRRDRRAGLSQFKPRFKLFWCPSLPVFETDCKRLIL
jgi:hypothetical protein